MECPDLFAEAITQAPTLSWTSHRPMFRVERLPSINSSVLPYDVQDMPGAMPAPRSKSSTRVLTVMEMYEEGTTVRECLERRRNTVRRELAVLDAVLGQDCPF